MAFNIPKSEKYIQLSSFETVDNKILYNLKFSDSLKKYFTSNQLEVEYDVPIKNVDESILSIPALSCLITIAWPTGANIYLEKIDETYFNSLQKLESILRNIFSQFSYTAKIYSKALIRNTFKNEGYTLLFSGGVDSLSSYIRHKKQKPILISVNGFQSPIPEYRNFKKLKEWLSNFASKEGLDIHFIKTNFNQIIKRSLFDIWGGEWWEITNFDIIILSLCAPLTTITKRGNILIASSCTRDLPRVSFNPLIDSNIRWDDIKVIHDGYEFSRHEKIKHYLKNNPKYGRNLRVCSNSRYLEYNCSNCEKCLRTITSLLLEDQDPKEYNFIIEEDIIEKIENQLANISAGRYPSMLYLWKSTQKHIPKYISDNKLHNSKKFFESFKKIDLPDHKYRIDNQTRKKRGYILYIMLKKYYFLAKYFGFSCSLKHILQNIFRFIIDLLKGHSLMRTKICHHCWTSNSKNRRNCLICGHQFPM